MQRCLERRRYTPPCMASLTQQPCPLHRPSHTRLPQCPALSPRTRGAVSCGALNCSPGAGTHCTVGRRATTVTATARRPVTGDTTLTQQQRSGMRGRRLWSWPERRPHNRSHPLLRTAPPWSCSARMESRRRRRGVLFPQGAGLVSATSVCKAQRLLGTGACSTAPHNAGTSPPHTRRLRIAESAPHSSPPGSCPRDRNSASSSTLLPYFVHLHSSHCHLVT